MLFIENKNDSFKSDEIYNIKSIEISDSDYWIFIKNYGDGFYFSDSFHVYGFSNKYRYHDIFYINKLLKEKYIWCQKFFNLICFAQDLFGNQFVFYNEGIGFLNIETGDIDFIAHNFKSFLNEFLNDLDYFTGQSISLKWSENKLQLSKGYRLATKIPFILDGAFEINNLYLLEIEKILDFNADLARQLYDLPDGVNIDVKVKSLDADLDDPSL